MSLIEIVIQTAKEAILEKGEHPPTLFVEYKSRDVALVYFVGMPDNALDRQKAFFTSGRKVGRTDPKKQVKTLIFAHEVWVASHVVGTPYPYARPSDDPARREALNIEIVDVSTKKIKQSMQTFEMIRGAGTIDLLAGEPVTDVQNNLLIAFLAGITSAKMSDKQFAKFLRKGEGK